MAQESIIDAIKRNIVLRKRFRSKGQQPFTFEVIPRVAKQLFCTPITKQMLGQEFEYHYLDRNGKKKTARYKIEVFDDQNGRLKVTRQAFDGTYKTMLELSKNRKALYYFETVQLKQAPFQIWGQVGLLAFRHHFRKRKKTIKKELYQNE